MTTSTNTKTVLKFDDVSMLYPFERNLFRKTKKFIHAVDKVSFEIKEGETLGLVGESGCGKSTVARLAVRLVDPTGGKVLLRLSDNEELVDLNTLSGRQNREFRGAVQLIFQDPYGSLNPRKTVFDTIAEPLLVNKIGNLSERTDRVRESLDEVRLNPIDQYIFAYPHELSGGQRQRVAIARALVLRPRIIVADEPTSMLDIAVRTSIMRLMLDLQQDKGYSYLYITHDMGVARHMAHRVAVMYLGKVVELGDVERVIENPAHPYTRALMSAVLGTSMNSLDVVDLQIQGSVSKPINPTPECRFMKRCLFAKDRCRTNPHPDLELAHGRLVSCYNPQCSE